MEGRRFLRCYRPDAEGAPVKAPIATRTSRSIAGAVAVAAIGFLIFVPGGTGAPGDVTTPASATKRDGMASGVAVFERRGAGAPSCGRVTNDGRFVAGRCGGTAYAFDSMLRVRTPLGSFDFGSCITNIDFTIGGDGRIWMDKIGVGGRSPCFDVRPCAPPEVLAKLEKPADGVPLAKAYPWKGRVTGTSSDRFDGHLDVCFDTCIGRYEGRIPIDLEHVDGKWHMRARDAGIGKSGLEIDVDWAIDSSAQFDLRAAR